MHLAFWNAETMQEFWSGQSFFRTDDGNLLSYELARIMVGHLAGDWNSFARFLAKANWEDAGVKAAQEELDVCLASMACAFLELPASGEWVPDARLWRKPAVAGQDQATGLVA